MVVCSQDDVFQIVSSLITGCCSSHSGSAFRMAPWVSDGLRLLQLYAASDLSSLLFDTTNI